MICELEIILHIMNFQGMNSSIKTHPVLKKHWYLENFNFLAENNYRIEIYDKFCIGGHGCFNDSKNGNSAFG